MHGDISGLEVRSEREEGRSLNIIIFLKRIFFGERFFRVCRIAGYLFGTRCLDIFSIF
jgi:hypothetical protein